MQKEVAAEKILENRRNWNKKKLLINIVYKLFLSGKVSVKIIIKVAKVYRNTKEKKGIMLRKWMEIVVCC